MRRVLTLSLAKPEYNAEEILVNLEYFIINGDFHYVTNSFCRNVLKIATPLIAF